MHVFVVFVKVSVFYPLAFLGNCFFFFLKNVYFNREKTNTHKCRTNIPIQ